jgi:capsular exopolysaccharide synthesis family protein
MELITITDPRSAAADAYRTLRTNLMFSRLDNPLFTLGITSPVEDNGKGRAAANLAVTLAQSGKKTILIDADLRRPSQHKIWGADNSRGLTTALLDDTAIELVDTDIDNLEILPSGELPANPVDVLASNKMDAIIEKLKVMADILVFDMPPVLVAADASVLGQKLDGVLLVLQANKTKRDHTMRAQAQLQRVNVNLLGAALIDSPLDRTSSQYR